MTADPVSTVVAAVSSGADPDLVPEVLSLAIPIVAVVLGLGMGMLRLWLDFRKKREIFQLHHAERMAAIEKGVEVPPLPPEFFQDYKSRRRTRADRLRSGLTWFLVGIAVSLALYEGRHGEDAWWGLVPTAVGLAKLLAYGFAPREESEQPDQPVVRS